MLWKIDGSEVHVLGALHVSNFPEIPFTPAMLQAFHQAKSVTFEMDLSGIPDLASLAIPDDGQLSQLLPPDVYAEVQRRWEALGIPVANLLKLQPTIAAMTLSLVNAERNGFARHGGIDLALSTWAAAAGKERRYLETSEHQLGVLTSAPLTEQVSFLRNLIGRGDLGLSEIVAMVTSWKEGDVGYFEMYAELRRQLWPNMFEALLDQRNRDWVPAIKSYVESGEASLVVVGALHMCGRCGLPDLLANEGYRLVLQLE